MNIRTKLLVFAFCILSLVTVRAGQSASESRFRYPNELPNLKIYDQAKWKPLKPYVSTVDDIERLLGKPVAVYDELLRTYVAGFQDDPDWTIVIAVVDKGGDLPDSVAGRLLHITLYPKRRVSLTGADFSAFQGATYTGRTEHTMSYHDKSGLGYVVFTNDSLEGRFHAGDLKSITYGPSDEETAKHQRETTSK